MNATFDNEILFKLLNILQKEPKLTQREMNQKMGVSLGKINYCISSLADKGIIKVERFKKTKNKSAYIYRVTPKGLEELTNQTVSFLIMKIGEYDKIKKEIKFLSRQIDEIDPALKEILKSIG